MSTPLAHHELVVAGGLDVLHEGVRDVGVDVVLRGAGRVVGGRLLAVDRPPREQRAAAGQLGGAVAGGVEHAVAEPQRVAGHVRRRVGEERQDVDLGVPEVVAARSRSPVTPFAGMPPPSVRAAACASWNRFQRTACWISGWPSTSHVAARPEVRRTSPAGRRNADRGDLARAVEAAVAAVGELTDGDAAEVWYAITWSGAPAALPGADPVDVLARSSSSEVVGPTGSRSAACGRPRRRWSSPSWRSGSPGCARAVPRWSAGCSTRSLNVPALRGSKTEAPFADVVLVGAVLPVQDLARDQHRGVAVEQRHLVGRSPRGGGPSNDTIRRGHDAHPLARRRAPHQLAHEHAVAEVERALVVLRGRPCATTAARRRCTAARSSRPGR